MTGIFNLKPCPFCGGTDVSVVDEGNFSFVECADCLGAFWQREACSVEDNVEAWNRRPTGRNSQIINNGTMSIDLR